MSGARAQSLAGTSGEASCELKRARPQIAQITLVDWKVKGGCGLKAKNGATVSPAPLESGVTPLISNNSEPQITPITQKYSYFQVAFVFSF
jgi:hypothetical protein